MNSNSVLFILFWIVVMLIIIHNCHKIINFVQENFDNTPNDPYDTDEHGPHTTGEPDPYDTGEQGPHTTDEPDTHDTGEQGPHTTDEPDTHISDEPEPIGDTNYICPSNSCPLASILSSYPNIGDKWGNDANECVKVSNSLDANCARCPPGTFIDYSNINDVCSPCPKNQYSDTYNQLQCKPCEGALEGASNCGGASSDASGNTNNNSQSDINLFEPSLGVETIVNEIYDGNMKKFKQNQVLKQRIQKLQNKLSNYAYLEKEIYKNSLA